MTLNYLNLLVEKHLPKRYYGHEARKHAKEMAIEYGNLKLQQYIEIQKPNISYVTMHDLSAIDDIEEHKIRNK